MNNAIETKDLKKTFRHLVAVDKLTLTVPVRSIFAFLGPNGAGKTTTIKILMNILGASSGKAKILDVDSHQLGPCEFCRIGYVSENQSMPEWMTAEEFLGYCKSMYSTWDDFFCKKLLNQFDIPLKQKISHFSRGMKMKIALVSSIAYRPKLLILDEPFSGLDPLIRDEFVCGILELSESEDWTIFISSHDINEVERLADWVGIIDKGVLKIIEKLESLQARFRKIEILTSSLSMPVPNLPQSWLLPEHNNRILKFIDSAYEENNTLETIHTLFPNCENIIFDGMTLKEIFIVLTKSFKLSSKEE
jgi:ABC-2 type transport system ATP-binding protein